jgi:polysaccharide export outer membrane protein
MLMGWDMLARFSALVAVVLLVTGCAAPPDAGTLPSPKEDYEYIIGPGDNLNIFVWRNPELSRAVAVRPDGKISVPLAEDLVAAGKTSTALAREVEEVLGTYIKEPLVTILIGRFQGVYSTQVRVVGEAAEPQAIPYRDEMTLLDVMIAVGGLTEFADGNKARVVRTVDGESHSAVVRIEDLIKDGDISANVALAPGDVIIIPEAWF